MGSKSAKEDRKHKDCKVQGCCNVMSCPKVNFYKLEVELTFSLNKYLSGVLTEVTRNEMSKATKKTMLKRMRNSKHPKFIINCPHKAEYLKCYEDTLCPPEQKQMSLGGDYAC